LRSDLGFNEPEKLRQLPCTAPSNFFVDHEERERYILTAPERRFALRLKKFMAIKINFRECEVFISRHSDR